MKELQRPCGAGGHPQEKERKSTATGLCNAWQLVLHTRPDFGPAKKMENGPYLGPWLGLNFGPTEWADMGLVSKEWVWVEGNGLRRCKGAE